MNSYNITNVDNLSCSTCVDSSDVSFNYAGSSSKGGAATSGDSATAFFSTGTIESARLPASISYLGSSISYSETDFANQNLLTSSGPTFASINTGFGAKEIGDSVGNCASTDVHKGDGGCKSESSLLVFYAANAAWADEAGNLTCTDCVNGSDLADNIALDANLSIDSNTLFIDYSNNRVGIGTANPQATLSVGGDGASGAVVYGEYNANNYGILGSNGYGVYGVGSTNAGYFENSDDPSDIQTRIAVDSISIDGDTYGTALYGLNQDNVGADFGIIGKGKLGGVRGCDSDYDCDSQIFGVLGYTSYGVFGTSSVGAGVRGQSTAAAGAVHGLNTNSAGSGCYCDGAPVALKVDINDYIQIGTNTAGVSASECDAAGELGRMVVFRDGSYNAYLYVCVQTGASAYGWRNTQLT
jgi:hypothetical protein